MAQFIFSILVCRFGRWMPVSWLSGLFFTRRYTLSLYRSFQDIGTILYDLCLLLLLCLYIRLRRNAVGGTNCLVVVCLFQWQLAWVCQWLLSLTSMWYSRWLYTNCRKYIFNLDLHMIDRTKNTWSRLLVWVNSIFAWWSTVSYVSLATVPLVRK